MRLMATTVDTAHQEIIVIDIIKAITHNDRSHLEVIRRLLGCRVLSTLCKATK